MMNLTVATSLSLILLQLQQTRSQVDFVLNILRLQHRELVFVTDFETQEQSAFVTELMNQHETPVKIVDLLNQASIKRPQNCSRSFSDDPHDKTSSLFVIWLSNTSYLHRVLDSFASTVSRCPTELRTGNYNRNNAFLFLIKSDLDLAKSIIFSDSLIQSHKNVALAHLISESTLTLYNYNIYSRHVESSFTWKSGLKDLDDISKVFPAFNMGGFEFNIGFIPYAAHVVADTDPNPKSPENVYVNMTGYEMEMLIALSEQLNFTYNLFNPVDQQIGQVGPDGNWTGLIGCAIEGKCDFIIGGINLAQRVSQVILASPAFDSDSFVFASPKPSRYINFLTLISPLDYRVWIATLVCLALMASSLYWIDRCMNRWYKTKFRDLDSLGSTTFYALGMMLGQHFFEGRNSLSDKKGALPIKISMTVWMAASFIIIAGYNGALRTFLISPSFENAIDTYVDILKSGKPWQMVIFGVQEEDDMAASKDPVISKIWAGKIPLPIETYNPVTALEAVFENKMIVLQWQNDLDTQVYVGFSTPTGEPLIHVSKFTIWNVAPEVWYFHGLNPWYDRFSRYIRMMIEGGLVDEWRRRTLDHMKANNVNKIIKGNEDPDVRKLTLADFNVVFLTLCIMYLVQVVSFGVEMCRNRFGFGRRRNLVEIA